MLRNLFVLLLTLIISVNGVPEIIVKADAVYDNPSTKNYIQLEFEIQALTSVSKNKVEIICYDYDEPDEKCGSEGFYFMFDKS